MNRQNTRVENGLSGLNGCWYEINSKMCASILYKCCVFFFHFILRLPLFAVVVIDIVIIIHSSSKLFTRVRGKNEWRIISKRTVAIFYSWRQNVSITFWYTNIEIDSKMFCLLVFRCCFRFAKRERFFWFFSTHFIIHLIVTVNLQIENFLGSFFHLIPILKYPFRMFCVQHQPDAFAAKPVLFGYKFDA